MDIAKNKVAILLCYFGPLPVNFDLWQESCGCNPSFDFYLITDQHIIPQYENVFCIPAALKDVRARLSAALNRPVALDHPYKLCDYKPMYGVAFQDILRDYEFWGMCDMDMIFGNLSSFIRADILLNYDKIFRLGHLTLYRNQDWVNWSFQRPGKVDWRDVIRDNYHHRLCERGMMDKHDRIPELRSYTPFLYIDVSKVHRRYRRSNFLVPRDCRLNYRYQAFYWEDGKVFRAARIRGRIAVDEFAYIHFQKRELKPHTVRPKRPFFITGNTFLEKEPGIPTLADIQKANPYPGFVYEAYEEAVYGRHKRKEQKKRDQMIARIEQERER